MENDDAVIEAAERLVERQTDGVVAGIRASLDAQGTADCVVCGEEIEPARRAVLPSAVRCVRCQGVFEHRGRT